MNNNDRLGCTITLLTGKKPFSLFKESHLLIHHPPKILATMEDTGNTPYLVDDLGFALGEDPQFYWRHLSKTLLSPKFYWDNSLSRLSNLAKAPLSYQVWTVFFLSLSSLIMSLTHTWHIGLTWWILTQLGTYAAALLQQLPEHLWSYEAQANEGAKSQIVNKSFILYLKLTPPHSYNIFSCLEFTAQIGLDILIRLTLLPVTLPAHGLHHALPNDKNWANQLVHLRDFQQGLINGWTSYHFQEVWGYFNALNYVFFGLSQTKLPS